MARAPLLQLSGISLTFGGDPVFDGLDLVVQAQDRVALVGRNGSGKSTLLKVMAGLVEPDRGDRVVPAGTSVGYMEQDPGMEGFATLGDYAASGLAHGEEYRVEMVAEGLKFRPDALVSTASGGERRRAALAKLMAEAPDLMLLDEPTNHLDLESITSLNDGLIAFKGTMLFVSHDHEFIQTIANRIIDITPEGVVDRGMTYDEFLENETVRALLAEKYNLDK